MDDITRAAWETMKGLQEVRDVCPPGSKEWEDYDRKFRKSEAEYHKVRPKGHYARMVQEAGLDLRRAS